MGYRVLNVTVSEKPKEKMEKVENPFKQFATPTKSLEHKPDNRSEKKEKKNNIFIYPKRMGFKRKAMFILLKFKASNIKVYIIQYNTKYAHTAPKDGMCVKVKDGKRIPM